MYVMEKEKKKETSGSYIVRMELWTLSFYLLIFFYVVNWDIYNG